MNYYFPLQLKLMAMVTDLHFLNVSGKLTEIVCGYYEDGLLYTKYVLFIAIIITGTTILYIMSAILSYSFLWVVIPITSYMTGSYGDAC